MMLADVFSLSWSSHNQIQLDLLKSCQGPSLKLAMVTYWRRVCVLTISCGLKCLPIIGYQSLHWPKCYGATINGIVDLIST